MKTNFDKKQSKDYQQYEGYSEIEAESAGLTKKEFQDYVINAGARGSFMIYRSDDKDEELGIDEL